MRAMPQHTLAMATDEIAGTPGYTSRPRPSRPSAGGRSQGYPGDGPGSGTGRLTSSGGQEGAGDYLVTGLVGVLVRPARMRRAFPGPPADGGDVPRQRAQPGHGDPRAEVRGVEGTGYVGDP